MATARTPRRINVRSLDFDGCIFNLNYLNDDKNANRLIKHNEAFIASECKAIDDNRFNDVIFMVGSNRQSSYIDFMNSIRKKSESCFPALNTLCKEFNTRIKNKICRVDNFLMSDLYGNKPSGSNFKNSIDDNEYKNSGLHCDWIFDDSKLSLLYAQMHKVASENRDAEIVFDFYDDRDDILNGLKNFLSKNSDLIPRNVTLRLHKYEGGPITNIATLSGTGEIDDTYRNTIKLMAQTLGANINKDLYNQELHFLNSFANHPEKLAPFIQQRQPVKPTAPKDLKTPLENKGNNTAPLAPSKAQPALQKQVDLPKSAGYNPITAITTDGKKAEVAQQKGSDVKNSVCPIFLERFIIYLENKIAPERKISVSIATYFARLNQLFQPSRESYIAMLIYIDRYLPKLTQASIQNDFDVLHLFAAALRLAMKHVMHKECTNFNFARNAGFSLYKMQELNAQFISGIGDKHHFTVEEYNKYERYVEDTMLDYARQEATYPRFFTTAPKPMDSKSAVVGNISTPQLCKLFQLLS